MAQYYFVNKIHMDPDLHQKKNGPQAVLFCG